MNRRTFIGALVAAPTVGVASAAKVVKEPAVLRDVADALVAEVDVAGGFLIPHDVAAEIFDSLPKCQACDRPAALGGCCPQHYPQER